MPLRLVIRFLYWIPFLYSAIRRLLGAQVTSPFTRLSISLDNLPLCPN